MAKGGQYERELSVQLSLWWSHGDDDSLFWRTAGSGARATTRWKKKKRSKGHCGDISSTDAESRPFSRLFTIEAKRGYPSATVHDLMDRKKKEPKYAEWIRKADAAKIVAGSHSWMIIHQRDRSHALMFMPSKIGEYFGNKAIIKVHTRNHGCIYGFLFNDWLEAFSPKLISSLLEKLDAEFDTLAAKEKAKTETD